MAKGSGIDKSIWDQKGDDMEGGRSQTVLLFKSRPTYQKTRLTIEINRIKDKQGNSEQPCDKCKFNLPAIQICHIIQGAVNNEHGIS